jgi:hypothetical protein
MTLLNEAPHDKLPEGALKWHRFAIITLGKNCSNIFNRNLCCKHTFATLWFSTLFERKETETPYKCVF